MSEERTVRYIGNGTIRSITSEDWERVGASNMPTTEWNFANAFSIPASHFTREALRYLKIDDRFEISS